MHTMLTFKNKNDSLVAINPSLVTCIYPVKHTVDSINAECTHICFTGGKDDFIIVDKPFSEVLKAIRYAN